MSAPGNEEFLNKTYYAWNTQGFLSDILDFLQFSEANIQWQSRRELQVLELRAKREQIEEEYVGHLRENVNGRFAGLTQRLRYAVLCAIVTTAEWTAVLYSRYAVPAIPPKTSSGKSNDPIHIFCTFNDRAKLGFEVQIATLQNLVYVRNCVTHNAGLLEGYKHQNALPDVVNSLKGFSLSHNPWVGIGIEIEGGVLDQHIRDMMDWMPKLIEECTKNGFIQH